MQTAMVHSAALIVAAFLSACGGSKQSDSSGVPTGVLLISVDSLRADHLSSYGYRSSLQPDVLTSPNIDQRLANEGLLFKRVISTTSWTVPAHMAMLSGQPDEIHGVKGASSRLHKSRPLIAQSFKRSGWRTAGFFSGPNLHPYFGFGRGFEIYEDCTSVGVKATNFGASTQRERSELRAMEDASHRGHTGDEVVARFSAWFDVLKPNERFFAFVHFWDVHYDYEPPAEFDLFDPDYQGDVDGTNIPELIAAKLPNPKRDAEHIIALYDGEIRYTDYNVGKLLDALDAVGRLNDTLIVFTADHGEEFADHGRFGHNKTLYEEVVKVPLILRFPSRINGSTQNDALVSLVDLAPTILELCEIAPTVPFWGRSLVPLLTPTGTLPFRAAPMDLIFGRPVMGHKREPMQGLHAGDHKVIRNRPGETPFVFDLEADPLERKALELHGSDQRLKAARKLWRKLEQEGARLPREEGVLPEDLADKLRDVGYLGEDE